MKPNYELVLKRLNGTSHVVYFLSAIGLPRKSHKLQDLRRFKIVTLKKGYTDGDLSKWFQMNVKKKAKGCRAIIYRLNDSAQRVSCWTLTAFPLKWTGPVLNDKGSIAEVEELELQGEGLQFNV